MKQDAILFVDVDDSPDGRYRYADPHFAAARARGLACLTAALSVHGRLPRLYETSDNVYFLDTLSETDLLDLLERLGGQYTIRAIFCHAGHASARGQVGPIVAQVARQLGLVHGCADAIATCNNKFLMRRALQKRQLRSVPFALCNDQRSLAQAAARIGFPLIAKPAFGAASVFIKKCSNWAELSAHYARYLHQHGEAACADFYGAAHTLSEQGEPLRDYIPGRSILLEGYIEGIEGTVECAIVDERVHPMLINEKLILTERSSTILENLLITPPVSFTEAQCEDIRQYAKDCLRAVGMTNSMVHFEFRMTEDGPVAIEINPRLGGLYVNAALRDLAGMDPYAFYISLLLGDPPASPDLDAHTLKASHSRQRYAMLAIYPEESGTFAGFEGLELLDDCDGVEEYAVQESGGYLNADIEEHYLLKCWVSVDDAAHAHALHEHFRACLKPIIHPLAEA